jgi:ELWxxDGT repeat protein
VHGREPWISDGTRSGTVLLSDIAPGPTGSLVGSIVASGDHVFFSAAESGYDGALWRSDGTEHGTVRVRDLDPAGNTPPLHVSDAGGGRVVFLASDGTEERIWASDGTGIGTVVVPTLDDGVPVSVRLLGTDGFVASGRFLYFTAHDPDHGEELWAIARDDIERACAGDCDRDGEVRLAELVAGVGIALARADLAACAMVDVDVDENVAISELVSAVRNAIEGCPENGGEPG